MDNPIDLTVARLIKQAREGDSHGRERLFASSRGYLDIVAGAQVDSWLKAKVDASDLVQQTLLEAHRDFDRFQGESTGEWLAWLRKIMSHNAADFVRRYHGAKRHVQREVAIGLPSDSAAPCGCGEPPAPGATPSQEFLLRDNELRVASAMAEMSDDHRDVVILRNLERLSFNEVAQRMGRTRPAVQMLWMRAIKKLQENLDS